MNDKQLQLVSFSQAKRLKAAGFDWEIYEYYLPNGAFVDGGMRENFNRTRDYFSAPTVALALKWMRDVKGIKFTINLDYAYENGLKVYYYEHRIEYAYGIYTSKQFRTFHEKHAYKAAESALLDKLLDIL